MEDLIKSLRRAPLILDDNKAVTHVWEQEDIKLMIPHRHPFLCIDKITDLRLSEQLIKGERYIAGNDPIFAGHFPGRPIYPSVLQVEMVAQLGLCLYYFIINDTDQVQERNRSIMAMTTKVHHASFHLAILPGQQLTVYSKVIDFDEITGIVAGQIFCEGKLCSYSILEGYLALLISNR